MNGRLDDTTFGLAVALGCGVVLGSAVAVSRFAYEGGASGVVVALGRCLLMTLVLALALRVSGRRLTLPRKLAPLILLNGSLMGLMTFGNIGAVEFIPVGLASLLFFTFPVVIALIVMALRIERVSAAKLAAIALAFVGLGVMLGVSVGAVDWRGTALSLMASFATAANAVLVGRFFRHENVFVVSLHFSLVAMCFLFVLALTVAPVRFPVGASGWAGVAGVAVFQSIGTPMYFFAIGRIGALKTGMATNIQPVVSIAEAWWWFDEVLGVLQACGGALVLVAIATMQWLDWRGAAAARREGGTGR